MKKPFHLFFKALFCFLVVSCSAGAQSTEHMKLPHLNAAVEVLRDKWGVNHIYAGNQHDLFFAQGYCAARDRLFQFEMWRRQATGTVAEILGRRELKRDIGARLFAFRGNMSTELNHYHARGKDIILAFVEGVNTYIEEANRHPKQLPLEFQLLGIKPGKWTPEVVVSRHQGVLGNIITELNMGRSVALAGEEKVKELMWFHPKSPLLTLDTAIRKELLLNNILEPYTSYRKEVIFEAGDITPAFAGASLHAKTDRLNAQAASAGQLAAHAAEGSNNWVLSGSRTASGHTLLANDPHRRITLPSLRYMVHLAAPGWNVSGAGEPEIPGVSIGHNEAGAWGITISETDGEDLFVYDLNPADLHQYLYNGKWVAMKELIEMIAVKNELPVQATLRYTVHGPVTYIDSANHKAYAVKSASLEPGGAPYLSSLRIDQAKTWETFREACGYSHVPALNLVWADTGGHIGWQTVGLVPVRKNFSGMVPVPGDGRYEWSGYLPIAERPHSVDPAAGFIATANQDLVPENFTHWETAGFTWPDAFRGDRLNEILSAGKKMNISRMKALQADYFSVPASKLVPMLRSITLSPGLSQKAKELVTDWNFVLDKNSIAAAIYVMWERMLMRQANLQFVPENIRPFVSIQTTRLIMWLEKPELQFGAGPQEARNRFLKETFEMAVSQLQHKLGDSMSSWQYGQDKYKHTEIMHPLGNVVAGKWKSRLNTASRPRGGYGHTIGSTGDGENQDTGASFRMITDTGNWDSSLMINTPGQSGNPASRYYKNLFPVWADDEYFPAYFSKKKVLSVTAEKFLMSPAAR